MNINIGETPYECQVHGNFLGAVLHFQTCSGSLPDFCVNAWQKPSQLYQLTYLNILREYRILYFPIPGGNYNKPELNGGPRSLPTDW